MKTNKLLRNAAKIDNRPKRTKLKNIGRFVEIVAKALYLGQQFTPPQKAARAKPGRHNCDMLADQPIC